MTRAEYDRLARLDFFRGEHVELVHGIVVAMSPIGPPHSNAVSRLDRLLHPRLLDRAIVRVQQPFVACDDSEPEPDVAVVPLGSYTAEHPARALLIIEVAESSLEYDRDTKGPLYAASGVAEYWVVDLAGRAIEVYSESRDGRYARTRRVPEGASVAPAAFPDVTVAVADLFR
jgi:Uma2 family endonuclease